MTLIATTGTSWYTDSSGVTVPTGQIHPILTDWIEKPVSSKRKKPVDLFANSTQRRVESVVTEYFYGLQRNSPWYGCTMNAPMSYWITISPDPSILEPSVADFASLDNRVRAKIKDQNVNLANALAEYKQTSSLLLSTAQDVVRTFHSLRSGRPIRDFVSMLKDPKTRNGRNLANRWLEYQYGWIPLLSDVKGSAEALAKTIEEGKLLFQTVKEKRYATTTTPYILGDIITDVELNMKVRVRYKVSSMGAKTLSETGFANPLSVAWEVIPWSFVIDWMIPVGDYLDGLDALSGVSQLTVVRSYKYQVKAIQALTYAGGGQTFGPSPHGRYKKIVTNRFSVDDSLSFGSLRFDPSLTKTRIANAMALLRQLKR